MPAVFGFLAGMQLLLRYYLDILEQKRKLMHIFSSPGRNGMLKCL